MSKSNKKIARVVIVGRPNVGKSTLFNRLIKKRLAIVDDQPGITRDRNESLVEWNGASFMVEDTGGYLPGDGDVYIEGIREHVQQAVVDADVLVFVTDAISGITPVDQEIARLLIKADRKTILVVNKADNEKLEYSIYDFYSLGFGDPLPVSAESGRRTGDLLDMMVELLPDKTVSAKEKETIHLAIVGKPNVGKSTFVNALLNKEKLLVSDIPGTTRDSIDSYYTYFGSEVVLIDTAGLRKKAQVSDNIEYYSVVRALRSIDRSDVTIVLIDAMDGITHQDKLIINEAITRKKGLVLAVNKWDLKEKGNNDGSAYEKNLRNQLGNLDYLPILLISCKHNLRLHDVIRVAFSVCQERNKRISTSKINEILSEILREKPPLTKDTKPIKVHYITQVATSPPVFTLFTNRPKAIAANYKRFLEKKIRENFGFFGVPISLAVRQK
ncbi:ribosome biogenesis GTPase Der [candidate division KSB1 bacterium]|nr:ribosome biogenesis GTPase Der [candidate division KSB1 bacterium]